MDPNDSIVCCRGSINGRWVWSIPWRRRLFAWEGDLARDLQLLLWEIELSEVPNRWVWIQEDSGDYTVS